MISKSSGKKKSVILWVAREGFSAMLLFFISGLSLTSGQIFHNQNASSLDLSRLQAPLAIEPLVQKARLSASDKMSYDFFGESIAISGDTIVVGVGNISIGPMEHAGAVYVFAKPTTGWATMTQSAKLTASDKAGGDYFGSSVAISGDVIVVGAVGADNAGAAYVFVKPSGGWTGNLTENAKLTASDKEGGDGFGLVAISGDTIVIGAGFEDPGDVIDAGSAYVFTKPAGGWKGNLTESAKLIASNKKYEDYFGKPAISGDVIAVSATSADPDGVDRAGAIYIFEKPAGGWKGTLTENAILTAGDKDADDHIGVSVSIWGDVVVAGAPYDDPGEVGSAGSAYVFKKQGSSWSDMSHTAKLIASDGENFDHLGESISITEDAVIVGAYTDSIGANTSQGSAYLFIMPDGGWEDMTETQKITAKDGRAGDMFGSSISIWNETVAVGAKQAQVDGTFNAGAAFVFEESGTGLNVFLPYVKR